MRNTISNSLSPTPRRLGLSLVLWSLLWPRFLLASKARELTLYRRLSLGLALFTRPLKSAQFLGSEYSLFFFFLKIKINMKAFLQLHLYSIFNIPNVFVYLFIWLYLIIDRNVLYLLVKESQH